MHAVNAALDSGAWAWYNFAVAKTLCVRVDRIGDLVLTLPADFDLRASGDEVQWLISRGLSFIPQHSQPPRSFYQVDREFSLLRLKELVSWLTKERFDRALIFHAPFWIYLAVFLARIPVRAGRYSQWFSFLLLNRGVRQSRKEGQRSEIFFNYQLVNRCLGLVAKGAERLEPLKLRSFLLPEDREALGLKSPYVVIHPGMLGSARNWAPELYRELAMDLSKDHQLVITGTPEDAHHWKPLEETLGERGLCLGGKLTANQLLGVLEGAELVVAPSTGVVHLAASLQVPTLGLYPPVKNQSPTRWGPKGSQVSTLVPEVDCPAQTDCLMKDCPQYDCMGKFDSTKLKSHARQMIRQSMKNASAGLES